MRSLLRSVAAGAAGLVSVSLQPGAGQAAEIRVVSKDADHLAVIVVSGEIKPGDGSTFANVAASLGRQPAAVMFGSPGGSLVAGLQIGQIIRLRHWATFVPEDVMCASACAFAWLAGSPRIMQEGSHIGFHAAYTVADDGTKSETGVGNAVAGAYMTNLGLSIEAIIYIERASPDEITWLTPAAARRYNIAVRVIRGTPGDHPPPEPGRREVRPASTPASPRPASPGPASPVLRPDHAAPSVLTPELVGPQTVPPAATDPNDKARRFVTEYFTHWSESTGEAIGFFSGAYASTVTFYGKSVDHDSLMQAKRSYAERWPVRVYNARPDSVRTFCNPANGICTVSGIVDWDCRNPARDATTTGAANFSLTVAFAGDGGRIMAESGSVITRSPR